jgi:large subunit ribosomal protein L15
MKLHDLKPAPGAKHRKKRVGRGEASGKGKTSGRGQKGTGARKNVPIGFEGGQMPIQRRLPKWGGFTNPNRVEYVVVNVARLSEVFEAGATVDPSGLVSHGLIAKNKPVKVLGHGDISKALTVKAQKFSKQAEDKIKAAGGTIEVV